jgi:hypothetical protein
VRQRVNTRPSDTYSLFSLASPGSDTDMSEIWSPVPRRHHLLQTESVSWLHSPTSSPPPPASPIPQRQDSPTNAEVRRRSRKSSQTKSVTHQHALSFHRATPQVASDASLARQWVRWMEKNGLEDWISFSAISFAVLIRCMVGLGPYSGWFHNFRVFVDLYH